MMNEQREPTHIISLGAGVQSSTMALMAACGELLPMPVAAIFADTQAEPESVYVWLDWLEKQLPFPVHRVTKGSLEDAALKMRTTADGRRFTTTDIPFFTKAADGELGRITHRSCTADYKIKPIMREAKRLVGKQAMSDWRRAHKAALHELTVFNKAKQPKPEYPVEAWRECQSDPLVMQWIGISTDEMRRMKDSRDPWAKTCWPLIAKRMSRASCLRWMEEKGFPVPPRSACVFCPFHDAKEWRRLQVDEPAEFEKAVQFEKATTDNFASTPYLHRSCKPLSEIDFRDDFERGQLSLWDNECEGICGV